MNFPGNHDTQSLSQAFGGTFRYLIAAIVFLVADSISAQVIDFNQDVRPLLSDNCFACHGPDAETREADLRLDLRDDALKNNDGARAIVPFKASESELIARIFSDDPDSIMPPPESLKKLSLKEKQTLRTWIEDGAPYQEHWSFQPIRSHDLPRATSRIYKNTLSDIDRFLLKKMEPQDLDLSPPADPITLMRRLSFDLLGLPAKSDWIERFSRNPTEEEYKNIVDEMISSPHFGERMAVFWLDLVRYADTIGYHSDTHREVSGYRDYVINSFNSNKRYDRFTIEQLAGDLLDQSDPWNRIASGYNRLLQTTEEGGAQAKEYRAIYAADRVRNVSGVWLGTTIGCAQCHDHKYDPFTTKDFYSMAAFFDDIKEPAVGKQQPNFKVPDSAVQKQVSDLDSDLRHLNSLAVENGNVGVMQFQSIKSISNSPNFENIGGKDFKTTSSRYVEFQSLGNPEKLSFKIDGESKQYVDIVNTAVEINGDLKFKPDNKKPFVIVRILDGGGSKLSLWSGEKPLLKDFDYANFTTGSDPLLIGLKESTQSIKFNLSNNGRILLCATGDWNGFDQQLVLSKKNGVDISKEFTGKQPLLNLVKPSEVISIGGATLEDLGDGSYLSKGKNPAKDTYKVVIPLSDNTNVHGFYLEALRHDSLASKSLSRANGNFVLTSVEVNLIHNEVKTPVKLAKPTASFEQSGWPISATIDKNPKSGWAVQGWQKFEDRQALFPFSEKVTYTPGSQLEILLKHESDHSQHNIGRFRISALIQPVNSLEGLRPIPQEIAKVIHDLEGDVTKIDINALVSISGFARQKSSAFEEWRQSVDNLQKQKKSLSSKLRTMLVVDRVEPRMTRILPRGNWLDETGEVVVPAVPTFLPKGKAFTSKDGSSPKRANRLQLAEWITDGENPLTARAFANRMWKIFYGYGLSRNLDDIGGQGEPPTHPELLDYLAKQFTDGGWNIKSFVRELVMTKAYQQSSQPTPWLAENDPGNRLYARQSRFRVDAEFVRDTALSISGLLVESVGGGNAKPYQPAGYWQHLNFPKRKYQADSDEGLYRRGIYTFWCRTFLHPAMLAFDAPSREECTAERPRSNTPQQALVLLNDIAFVEAANALAVQSITDLVNNKRIVGKLPADLMESSQDQFQAADFDSQPYTAMAFPGNVVARIFQRATSRLPDHSELSVLTQLYAGEQKRFAGSFEDAKSLLQTGHNKIHFNENNADKIAAMASVARTVMNLYETVARY